MQQHEWIKLLKVDPEQAVKVLLRLEVHTAQSLPREPSEIVRNAVPGCKSANDSKLLAFLDTGLCEWFQQMRAEAPPVNALAYATVCRYWDAIHIVREFDLPKTRSELSEYEEEYLEWFRAIPDRDFIRSPLQGYMMLMKQIKGN